MDAAANPTVERRAGVLGSAWAPAVNSLTSDAYVWCKQNGDGTIEDVSLHFPCPTRGSHNLAILSNSRLQRIVVKEAKYNNEGT